MTARWGTAAVAAVLVAFGGGYALGEADLGTGPGSTGPTGAEVGEEPGTGQLYAELEVPHPPSPPATAASPR